MKKQDVGIIGLGVMGENLALNIERNGFSVVGFDLDPQKVSSFESRTCGKNVVPARDLAQFLNHLQWPRRILMMVPAGAAVDSVIAELRPHLAAGDLLIDGGNTLFSDTERRIHSLGDSGVLYLGTGVSGGEEGALLGPSIMPGGDPRAWPLARPLLQAIAAKSSDGVPCCDWIGKGGSGHFVKMVHNGIEYGDMQMICEAYWLMKTLLGMQPEEMSEVFSNWNEGELSSYLVEITAKILRAIDPESKRPMIEMILDTAAQKGTGKWASQAALDLGVPASTIADSVFARALSAIKAERVAASTILSGPQSTYSGDRDELVEMIRKALFSSKICAYAQGFQLLKAADEEYGWELRFGAIASLWRAGCIIRAQFLCKLKEAYDRQPRLTNLLLDGHFSSTIARYHGAWRSVVAIAATYGVPAPAFMSALSYYDGYRSSNLPANLLQAQRDYFGAHSYQRVDREGRFHSQWTEESCRDSGKAR